MPAPLTTDEALSYSLNHAARGGDSEITPERLRRELANVGYQVTKAPTPEYRAELPAEACRLTVRDLITVLQRIAQDDPDLYVMVTAEGGTAAVTGAKIEDWFASEVGMRCRQVRIDY